MPCSPFVAPLLCLSAAALGLAGCGDAPPDNTRWEDAQNRTTGGEVATADLTGEDDDPFAGSEDATGGADEYPDVWTPPGATPAEAPDDAVVMIDPDLPSQAVDAGSFNKYFPEESGDYDMVPKQEKGGTAIWDLERDEVVLCQFSITDVAANPRALEKYKTAEMKIDGYPAVAEGSRTTAMLVNSRYQVKASSRDDSFSEADRKAWLNKFDLAGLAAMDALAD